MTAEPSSDFDLLKTLVSEETSDTLMRILEEGVSGNGGSRNAYVAGYRVAAKTGTSEKIGDDETLRQIRARRASMTDGYGLLHKRRAAIIGKKEENH